MRRYFDRKPGYLREEVRQAAKRLTDQQFLGKVCHHSAKRCRHKEACTGWNRTAWARHTTWLKEGK